MLTSLLILVTAVAVATSATEAPKWESDYGKALEQVRSDDRPLLVVLDKPGEEIDAELLGGANDSMLMKYDLCHVDVSTEYGKKVAEAFNAKTFPHVAFVDKTGEVVLHTHRGEISAANWQAALERYESGVQPERHVVLRSSYSEAYQPVYRDSSYCPSCQRGF